MRDIDVRELLGPYASGTLSPDEERRLHEAALDDQELFEALAEEDRFREALEDEVFRERLKSRLRQLNEQSLRGFAVSLSKLFKRPVVWLAAGPVAAVLLVGIGLLFNAKRTQRPPSGFQSFVSPSETEESRSATQPDSTGGDEEDSLERFWYGTRVEQANDIKLSLNVEGEVPKYEVGDWLRIEFSLPQDADVMLLHRHREGDVTQLFPNRNRPSATVQAAERVTVPDEEQGYYLVEGPSGLHRLRLLVFPPGTYPLKAGEAQRPLTVERQYRVVGEATR